MGAQIVLNTELDNVTINVVLMDELLFIRRIKNLIFFLQRTNFLENVSAERCEHPESGAVAARHH